MPAKKCPSKTVVRKSYTRKNSRAKTSKTRNVHVKRACVPDVGKKGKTPKAKRILPALKDDIHLRKYGYGVHKSDRMRHNSLSRASEDIDPLIVLRHLNLIRNKAPSKSSGHKGSSKNLEFNKSILSKDVNWMRGYYARHKGSSK